MAAYEPPALKRETPGVVQRSSFLVELGWLVQSLSKRFDNLRSYNLATVESRGNVEALR